MQQARSFYAVPSSDILPTGFVALDRLLPGGGWPTGAVIEIVAPNGYVDPVTLLLPALAMLSSGPHARWISWIVPPHLPVAEDLAEQQIRLDKQLLVHPRRGTQQQPVQLVAQALAAGNCDAILAWVDELDTYRLRKLSDAARRTATTVFLFRPGGSERQRSEAELRVFVSTHSQQLNVEILQCRCRPGTALQLPSPGGRPMFTPRYYRRQRPPLAPRQLLAYA